MREPGGDSPITEMHMYPYVREVSRDKTYIRYEVRDSKTGEVLAWMDERINPRLHSDPEPHRKRLKSEHYAANGAGEHNFLHDPTSIFVSGLDVRTTKTDILRHFASLGQITRVTRLHSNETGRFNGSAYVQYRHISSASEALYLDGSFLRDCAIIVKRKLWSDEERLQLQESKFENGVKVKTEVELKVKEYMEDDKPVKDEDKVVAFDHCVIVTNLSPDTTPLELAAHFQTVGDIQSVNFNQFKVGEAIIRFKESKGVDGALTLNMTQLEGFLIDVQRSVGAKARVSLPPQSVEFNNNQISSNVNHCQPTNKDDPEFDDCSIFISNIDHFASDSELAGHFRDVGDIARLTRLKNKSTGYNNGNAYIQFKEASSVGWALELNGSYLRDSCLSIQRKKKYISQ